MTHKHCTVQLKRWSVPSLLLCYSRQYLKTKFWHLQMFCVSASTTERHFSLQLRNSGLPYHRTVRLSTHHLCRY